jgi:pyruvate dehydrogenase E2 component (dihydrolipoamide acetyltransferase)
MVEDVLKFKRLDGAEAALTKIRDANLPGDTQRISIAKDLADLTVPVLVVVGEADRIIPPEQSASLSGSARRVVVKSAGHLPHMEKSGEVNAALAKLWG